MAFGWLLLTACHREADAPEYESRGTPSFPVDNDYDGFDVSSDCNDSDPAVFPGATEHCDGVDEDCSGVADDNAVDPIEQYTDADGDGYGAGPMVRACAGTAGLVVNADDCDDALAESYPDALELCDGLDNDCDGMPEDPSSSALWYTDADGDGYGDPASFVVACDRVEGATRTALDCDDDDEKIHPDADEQCGDEVDTDCSGRPSNGCEGYLLSAVSAYYTGPEDGSGLGWSVANVGDTDGDSRDDVLVGAPFVGTEGAAYLVTGEVDPSSTTIEDAYAARVSGDASHVALGWTVASAGDVGADGYNDLLVVGFGPACASSVSASCIDVGVYFGPVSGELGPRDADGRIATAVGYTELGAGTSHGDVDGDGHSDIVLGGPSASIDETYSRDGAVFVFAEPATGTLHLQDATATLQGDSDSWTGASLSKVADDDGDGIGDIAVGAPNQNDGAGAVLVLHGPLEGNLTSADADVLYTSRNGTTWKPHRHPGDAVGAACEWVGDLDGDGHPELAEGAPGADEVYSNSGVVHVIYGPHAESLDVLDADAKVYAEMRTSSYYGVGFALAAPGDLDGDGLDDLILGEPRVIDDLYEGGGVLVFAGPVWGPRAETSADWTFAAPEGASAGADIDVLDFDGDGDTDVLVGAAADRSDWGRVYVLLGSAF